MQLWRLNIKPDSQQGLDATEFCVERKIAGVGWGVGTVPTTKDEYRKAAAEAFENSTWDSKWHRSWTKATNAILDGVSIGDLIWTRNRAAVYYLGRVDGEWEYRSGAEYRAADIANVRPCVWAKVGQMDNVPGSVIRSFGPGATIQPVYDQSAAKYSSLLFGDLANETVSSDAGVSDILSLLSAEDLEDVVAIYLQLTKRLVMFPSTCKKDTMTIECLFADPQNGERIGLQVKSGDTPINVADYSSVGGKVILFAACGVYNGNPNSQCECLDPSEVRQFVSKHGSIMPARIQFWLDYVNRSPHSRVAIKVAE